MVRGGITTVPGVLQIREAVTGTTLRFTGTISPEQLRNWKAPFLRQGKGRKKKGFESSSSTTREATIIWDFLDRDAILFLPLAA